MYPEATRHTDVFERQWRKSGPGRFACNHISSHTRIWSTWWNTPRVPRNEVPKKRYHCTHSLLHWVMNPCRTPRVFYANWYQRTGWSGYTRHDWLDVDCESVGHDSIRIKDCQNQVNLKNREVIRSDQQDGEISDDVTFTHHACLFILFSHKQWIQNFKWPIGCPPRQKRLN